MALIPHNTTSIIFTGTYSNLVFYCWRGKYCVRTRSTLSGKRVKTAPQFRVTMQYAERLGRASKIASHVYRQLSDGWKLHSLYRTMTGLGTRLLKEREQSAQEIETALWQYLASIGFKWEHDVIHNTQAVSKIQASRDKAKKRRRQETTFRTREQKVFRSPIINQRIISAPVKRQSSFQKENCRDPSSTFTEKSILIAE